MATDATRPRRWVQSLRWERAGLAAALILAPVIAILAVTWQRADGGDPEQDVVIQQDGSPIAMGTERQALRLLADGTGMPVASTSRTITRAGFKLFKVNIRVGDMPPSERAAVQTYTRTDDGGEISSVMIITSTFYFGPPETVLSPVSLPGGTTAQSFEEDSQTHYYFVSSDSTHYLFRLKGAGFKQAEEMRIVADVVNRR